MAGAANISTSWAPSLNLSDHSSSAGYMHGGGVNDGAFNVSFGSGAAGTAAPASGFSRYLPVILIGAVALYLVKKRKL